MARWSDSELSWYCLGGVVVPSSVAGYVPLMEPNDLHLTKTACHDAVVEALLAPGESSFVDALLALADDVANNDRQDRASRAIGNGFQTALARRMRAAMNEEGARRRAS